MESRSRQVTHKYAMVSSVVSLISHPIPGMDELLVIPIQYQLCFKVAQMKNIPIRDLPWMKLHKIIYGGAVARFCCDIPFALIPFVGTMVHAMTAGALTVYLGRCLDALPKDS